MRKNLSSRFNNGRKTNISGSTVIKEDQWINDKETLRVFK